MGIKLSVAKLSEYSGHKGSIFALALDEDERFLYSAGDDGIVAKWDLLKTSDEGDGIIRIDHSIYSLLYIEHKQLLIAGASDGTVYFVYEPSRELVHTYRKTTDAVYGLYYQPENDSLWILQGSGFLGIVALETFEVTLHRRLTDKHLRCLVWNPLNHSAFIGTSNNYILVLDKEGDQVLTYWEAHTNSVFALALDPLRRYLLSGGRDAYLNSWDLGEGYPVQKQIPAHNFTINDIVFAPDALLVATAGRDKTIKIWEAATLELIKVIDHPRNDGHQHSVNKIKWLKSDNSLISCGDDRRILRWRVEPSDNI